MLVESPPHERRATRVVAALLAFALIGCGQTISPAGPDVEPGGPAHLQPDGGQAPPGLDPFTLGLPAAPSEPGWPPLQTSVPTYALEVARSDLDLLESDPDEEIWVPGRMKLDGKEWAVQLAYRGKSTRDVPKKSWTIRFESAQPPRGRPRLELLAQWADGACLTEKLWYDLAAAVGVRVPEARYVNLEINGRYYGLMTELERIDKAFLRAHGFYSNSDIYRCGMFDCELRDTPREPHQRDWTKRTNEDQPWDNLWGFLGRLNRTPPHQLRELLERELDLERYLSWLAVDAVASNNNIGDSRSFLVYDFVTGQWSFVPWDLNNSKAVYHRYQSLDQGVNDTRALLNFTAYDPYAYQLYERRRASVPTMKPTWSVLNTRIYDDEELRARLVAKLRRLLDTYFREEEIRPRLEATYALIEEDLRRDPYVDTAFAERGVDYLVRYVVGRREFLLQNLAQLEQHNATPLKIDRVGLDASGQPFVDIHNSGADDASLGGLYVTGHLRDPDQVRAPDLRVPAGEHVRLSGSRLGILLDLEHPEVGLFGSDGMPIDLLYLSAPLRPGQAYGRSPRGSERFGEIAE